MEGGKEERMGIREEERKERRFRREEKETRDSSIG